MKAKKILMLMSLCALTFCVQSQNKVDKFFGNLNGAVQIYERYETLNNQVKRMRPTKKSTCGTIVQQQYGKPLKSLTWSNIQIERQGPYLYVWEVRNGKFSVLDRHALSVNNLGTEYDCYILRGNQLYHYTVNVEILAKRGYVYLKNDSNEVLENYVFSDR